MLKESLQALNIDPEGIYVDATFGGGGHSREILSQLKKGKLIAFDKDPDSEKNLPADDRVTFVNHDYRFLKNFVHYLNLYPVNGILADLGVSSHQFDTPERGFSFRYNAPLDMRMDNDSILTAKTIINSYPLPELQRIFGKYGEIRNAIELANAIVSQRQIKPIETTDELVEIIRKVMHSRDKEKKYLGQVFQAIRIEVNQELEAVESFLNQSAEVLAPGGRLVVITYHSLEDRLVKNFINKGSIDGKVEKDIFGREQKPLKAISRKPIIPDQKEIDENPRARSAKLRIGEKY